MDTAPTAAGPTTPADAAAPLDASITTAATSLPIPLPVRRNRVTVYLKAAIAVVVIAFVAWALVKHLQQVRWSEVSLRPLPAVLAVLAMLAVSATQLVMFRSLLLAYGYRLPWAVQLAAAWVPPLGKYVPGKVASVAGAVYLLRTRGVPGAVAFAVALMLDGLAVIAGLIVSTPLLLWEPVRRQLPTAWAWCAALAAAGLVALHPRLFVGGINLLLTKVLRRQPLATVPKLGQYLVPVIASFTQWLFAGVGLWLMTYAVTEPGTITPRDLPLFIATAALAMTLSYLALFAPGGLGVREGLYLLTLGPIVGPRAAIVVVAMRVIQTLIEVSLAGAGLAALRKADKTPGSTPLP